MILKLVKLNIELIKQLYSVPIGKESFGEEKLARKLPYINGSISKS